MDRTKTIALSLLFLTLAISVWCQSAMYVGWDVGWRLHITQIFLSGGNYLTHFIDINPPMLMYEFIPAVLLAKWTGLSAITTLRIAVYILATASWWLCYRIQENIFSKNESFIYIGIMTAIAVAFLIVPAMEFGQQEHWVVILILPYLLNASLLVNGKTCSKSLRFWIALFAALGFITNVLYLLIFIVVECYLAIKQKSFKTLLRLDPFLILVVLVLYIISIFIFTPNYVQVVFPLSLLLFFEDMRLPWTTLLNNSTSVSCLLTLIFFPFHYKHSNYKPLYAVLFIALIGFYAIFLLTHKIWYFHLIPTISMTLILLALYLIEDTKQLRHLKQFTIKTETWFLVVTILIYATILILPLRDIYIYNRNALAFRHFKTNEINTLIQYVKNAAEGKAIYIFSSSPNPVITLMDYANVKIANKMPGFWALPAVLQLPNPSLSPSKKMQLEKTKKWIFQVVIKSFKQSKPDLVIVEKNPNFSYIKYFSQDREFQKIWSHYHFVYQINDYAIFMRARK